MRRKMKRVIISGAGGFLGKHLIQEALKQDISVFAITSHPDALSFRDIEIIETDRFLSEGIALCDSDIFINCLFPTNADGIRMADGLSAVFQTISAAGKCNVGAFINISSQSVYPSKRTAPASEDTQLSLETPYAVGKYSSEAFCGEVFRGKPFTNIRLASLIGVGYEQRIINRMISQIIAGETLNVIGGMQRYGFLDVRDAAAGIIRMIKTDPDKWKKVYNLGPTGSYTLLELAEIIVQRMREYGFDADYNISEGADNRNSAIDASLFMRDLDWRPEISVQQTVDDIIQNKTESRLQ